jgi:hypothetical protein
VTLALLVPNDYRKHPVLVRLGTTRIDHVHEIDRDRLIDTIDSVNENGGKLYELHRDDQTNPSIRRPR